MPHQERTDQTLSDFIDKLIADGRSVIDETVKAASTQQAPDEVAKYWEVFIEASGAWSATLAGKLEATLRALPEARLALLYAERETYPFETIVSLATHHVLNVIFALYWSQYMDWFIVQTEIKKSTQLESPAAVRRLMDEAVMARVLDWICPLWPFC